MDDGYLVPTRRRHVAFRIDGLAWPSSAITSCTINIIASGGPSHACRQDESLDRFEGASRCPPHQQIITITGRARRKPFSASPDQRNCAGGTTPWGSWLSCEEDVSRASAAAGLQRDHGWVFEIPALARGTVEPVPLTAMGRFNHEAAAVDPRTGIVYLTEDREDSLLYRFLPAARGQLARGGRLQALAFADRDIAADTRNWAAPLLPVRDMAAGALGGPRRTRGRRTICACAAMPRAAASCTPARASISAMAPKSISLHQWRRSQAQPNHAVPSVALRRAADRAERAGRLQIFVESTEPSMLNFGDNLTVAPNGHLIICEDQYTDPPRNRLKGVTPRGDLYDLALLHEATELAGACFSPDGRTMFLNVYNPTKTLAITGPWTSR